MTTAEPDARALALAQPGPPTTALEGLTEADLVVLERQVATIAAAAPGLDELFRAIRDTVALERSRGWGGRRRVVVGLPDGLAAAPADVIRDQREAMVRAIELREDPRLPDGARHLWADVVVRLARYRRDAKTALARGRRLGMAEGTSFAAEAESLAAARRRQVVTAVPSEDGGVIRQVDAAPDAKTLETAAGDSGLAPGSNALENGTAPRVGGG